MKTKAIFWLGMLTAALFSAAGLPAQEEGAEEAQAKTWTSEEAWGYISGYNYGDDFAPLLLIENEVEEANKTPETESAMAAKLASFLTDDCTLACRQFACMQLRLVGTAAEVPALANLFNRPEECENARLALEVIPGEESAAVLRAALDSFQGTALIGVINSLAKRQDAEAFAKIVELSKSDDEAVAKAAIYAFGKYGAQGLAELANLPVEDQLAGQAALNVADEMAAAGDTAGARAVYEKYAVEQAQRGCRHAAVTGLLKTAENKNQTVIDWFSGTDVEKIRAAAACLNQLSDEEFAAIAENRDNLAPEAARAFIEIAAIKDGKSIFDDLVAQLEADDPVAQLTALRLLGQMGNPSAVSAIIPLLASANEAVASAAGDAVLYFPAEMIGPVLVDTMKANGPESMAAAALLAQMKYYEAIAPMIEMAMSKNPEERDAPIDGLSKLADPDDHDLPRLWDLYVYAAKNGYRDKVERALVIVCKKSDDAVQNLVAAAAKAEGTISDDANVLLLPLLGKLGGEFAYNQIEESMKSGNAKIKAAAFRGFCNWPDATYADELWSYATTGESAITKTMALRAYIRVISLKSDRPAAETLELLQKAFDEAKSADDKNLVLQRVAEARDMATVRWLAGFLDDEALSETACASIAKMAHHRELREPNKDEFAPILEKVEQTAKNKDVAEAAKKARMGM